MRKHDSKSPVAFCPRSAVKLAVIIAIAVISSGPTLVLREAWSEVVDPLANGPTGQVVFGDAEQVTPATEQPATEQPIAATTPHRKSRKKADRKPQRETRLADFQTNKQTPSAGGADKPEFLPPGKATEPKDPCSAVPTKPLTALGINIAQPAGTLPTDMATPCWNQINQTDGRAALRSWPVLCYNWEATCFYHQPLYFEEINLERYGYGCDCCLQPFASAAHFFGTVPALPYCIVAEPPGDCVYTLGHYRPGSCPPWRWHWPECDPFAAAAAGGIWTGIVFLIP